MDKAGPGWKRLAQAGQGQWKSRFRVVDWPGPAGAWPGQRYFQIFTGLARPSQAEFLHGLGLVKNNGNPGRRRGGQKTLPSVRGGGGGGGGVDFFWNNPIKETYLKKLHNFAQSLMDKPISNKLLAFSDKILHIWILSQKQCVCKKPRGSPEVD